VKITSSTPRIEVFTVSDDQVSLSLRKAALTCEHHVNFTAQVAAEKRASQQIQPASFRLSNFLIPIAFHNQLGQDGA
jgi:hypothetical protein